MPKSEDLQKHTLNLRAGDVDKLRDFFPEIPPTNLIRQIVSRYVDDLDSKANLPNVEVKL